MSVDFATFNVTELAVLDSSDAVGMPEMGSSVGERFTEDMDDLIGEGTDMAASCCSSCCSTSCC